MTSSVEMIAGAITDKKDSGYEKLRPENPNSVLVSPGRPHAPQN